MLPHTNAGVISLVERTSEESKGLRLHWKRGSGKKDVMVENEKVSSGTLWICSQTQNIDVLINFIRRWSHEVTKAVQYLFPTLKIVHTLSAGFSTPKSAGYHTCCSRQSIYSCGAGVLMERLSNFPQCLSYP
jgi:hypothetical protein